MTGGVVNPGVVVPGSGNSGVSPTVGDSGKVPSLAPIMAGPSGQAPASPGAGDSPGLQEQRQGPARPERADGPGRGPGHAGTAVALDPRTGLGDNTDAQHREVMAALNGINESLKRLVERK